MFHAPGFFSFAMSSLYLSFTLTASPTVILGTYYLASQIIPWNLGRHPLDPTALAFYKTSITRMISVSDASLSSSQAFCFMVSEGLEYPDGWTLWTWIWKTNLLGRFSWPAYLRVSLLKTKSSTFTFLSFLKMRSYLFLRCFQDIIPVVLIQSTQLHFQF